jgi:hypothetical protein
VGRANRRRRSLADLGTNLFARQTAAGAAQGCRLPPRPTSDPLPAALFALRIGLVTGARRAQRALIVLFALLPLLIVTLASVPALALLPFFAQHSTRARAIVQQLITWTRTTLVSSRNQ